MFPISPVSRFRATSTFVRGILAGLIAISLLSVLGGTPNNAAAERVPPGGDTFQQGCRALQDQYNKLIDERDHAKTDADRQKINGQINSVVSNWNDLCKGLWGSISELMTLPPKPVRASFIETAQGVDTGSDGTSRGHPHW
ncbi:MAG: hypothetical protein WBW04_18500 [Nitrolancea sp.]